MVSYCLVSRERQIKDIEASFEACKSRPVHATNKTLQPVEVLPLLPYFDRFDACCFPLQTILYLKIPNQHICHIVARHVATATKHLKSDTLQFICMLAFCEGSLVVVNMHI